GELRNDGVRVCLGLVAARAGLGHEDRAPVVAQLADGLEDVGEGAMTAVLRRGLEEDAWIPSPGELLDARDVHIAVVEVSVDLGHVLCEEHPIGADRVAGQGRLSLLGDEAADVLHGARLRLGERDPARDLVQES
ncbi:hypothetical protein ABE10_03825, partial [Bacillus toyonensis]|nr:hypothetical protein [Bacillus toyonensis]